MSFVSRIMAVKRQAHFEHATSRSGAKPRNPGRDTSPRNFRSRIVIVLMVFVTAYGVVGARLTQYGFEEPEVYSSILPPDRLMASRPDLVDRNGEVMATDIRTVSLFAEPTKILDPDEAAERLASVLPDLDRKSTYMKLASKSHFQWLKRQLTPKQQSEILALGIPGIGFRPEKRRFYPAGSTSGYITGHVNIDNRGIAGMEKYVDSQGLADLASTGLTTDAKLEPVKLSVDLRVQNILRDVLLDGVKRYEAIAAGAVVIDVHTGEVIGMTSVPDYDPNNPAEALDKERMNRMSAGTYEMGSTFKTFTTAMAIDSGKVKITDSFDARFPLRIGKFTIHDFHSKGRFLSVPEIFIYSSNIGTARMADLVGVDEHKAFLAKMGLTTRLQTELPEIATPSQPREWKKINSITISFGHGVSTTPLQTAVAAAALMNDGKYIPPTFLPRSREEAQKLEVPVVKRSTADDLRTLFRMNVLDGSGHKADVVGFNVGGKTGTAEKVINGRYAHDVRFNAFLAGFPIDKPQYVVLVVIDEPKGDEVNPKAGLTAGSNAAPMVGEIVRRAAPILGVKPKFGPNGDALLVSY